MWNKSGPIGGGAGGAKPAEGKSLDGRAIVQVQTKAVTGRVRYYPVGPNAKSVLQLTKKKTLSELDLEALKSLGCRIEIVPGEPKD